MMNFFAKSTVWKRTTIFGRRSLLSLTCCLIAVLGGMLFTNESHAQTCEITAFPGDRVVLQNVKWLNVRSEPRIRDNKIGKVYNGNEGTLRRDRAGKYVKEDGKYEWHYVKWDHLRKAGWTAGLIDDQLDPGEPTIKWISTIVERDQKDAIVEALFNNENRDETSRDYIHHDQTIHDYNDYGCNATWGKPYGYPDTGHSGWDVAAFGGAVPFYSLTAGKLLLPNANGETDNSNTIAVYDEDSDMTILYLHASDILVNPDDEGMVHVGNKLGTQGNTSPFDIGVHVHIEIQKGESKIPVYKTRGNETINPIPYLYEWIIGDSVGQVLLGDVNRDGQVNWDDLLLVMQNRGTDNPRYDVNSDGDVNWDDVFVIWDIIWEDLTGFAPAVHTAPIPPANQTFLLPNYPNPFNPETWIPYSLAEDADVTLTIYDTQGTEVRRFDLGQQPAGYYIDRRKSIYWDGRNMLGKQVGSGVYFYHLQAGNYSATRRMVILK